MAKLRGVKELDGGKIEFNGVLYEKIEEYGVADIVKSISDEYVDVGNGDYFATIGKDEDVDIQFKDNASDERAIFGHRLEDYEYFRKVQQVSKDVQEIVINSPVRLVINGPVTIEIKSEDTQ